MHILEKNWNDAGKYCGKERRKQEWNKPCVCEAADAGAGACIYFAFDGHCGSESRGGRESGAACAAESLDVTEKQKIKRQKEKRQRARERGGAVYRADI